MSQSNCAENLEQAVIEEMPRPDQPAEPAVSPRQKARERREARIREMAEQQQQLFKALWQRSVFQEVLDVHGWQQIEPVILASLIAESPLLLVGPHGTAKTYFFERLAQSLNLEFRFYNTSILNFDDLIGVPVPSPDFGSLHYISAPSAVWSAQAVFFDEINRTRPELQNKIFPIVHERRVQGILLDKLRYRWAAMNPVCLEEESLASAGYFGAMPLDHALADRFHFIVQIPDWKDLADHTRRALLTQGRGNGHNAAARDIQTLVSRGQAIYAGYDLNDPYVAEYLMQVVSLLAEHKETPVELSTRRIMILRQNIFTVQAALRAMAERIGVPAPEDLLNVAGLLALENSLPQPACGNQVNPGLLQQVHMKAWHAVMFERESRFSALRRIRDAMDRVKAALMLAKTVQHEEIDAAFIHFLSTPAGELRVRQMRAFAFYMAARSRLNLSPRVLDALLSLLKPIMQPQQEFITASFGKPNLMKLREKAEKENDPFGCFAFNLLIQKGSLFLQEEMDAVRAKCLEIYEQLAAALQ
ncbi:MAG TPA: MoxR family ATPase [Candidatus Hydrogenedentes bacterium]|nr:MoxR family ATPase [Candidatus Hydrogenedentota bacterium]